MSCLNPAIETASGAIALHTMPGVTQYKKTEVALPGRLNYLRKSGEHPVSVNVLYQTPPAPRPVVTATPAAVFRTYLQPVERQFARASRRLPECPKLLYRVVALSRKTI